MRNREIIDKIIQYHPQAKNYHGCDGYKYGDPEDECRGVAVALVPIVEVIEKAYKMGCNLLITHEPIYYQTPDYPEWKGAFQNSVADEKMHLLCKNGMTVWRNHDHMHQHQPDAIFSGVLKQLGWEKYEIDLPEKIPLAYGVELPNAVTVAEMGRYLVEKIGINGVKYIGRDEDSVKRILIAAHLYPNGFYPDGMQEDGFYHDYSMDLMQVMEMQHMDALIPGEIIEWTILSYIRDAISLGRNRSCFNIGHFALEELGMKEAVNWTQGLAGDAIQVRYIHSGEAFSYHTSKKERGQIMNKNGIIEIIDGVYQIKYYWLGIANVYMYLIVGGEKAMLIDSGYSITGALQYVREITLLPVVLVNTHGHFDHIGGNADIGEAFLSEADWETACQHSDYGYLKKMMAHYKEKSLLVRLLLKLPKLNKEMEESLLVKSCKYNRLPAEGFFELGNRRVYFLETPGHTMGSICLFDEKTKSLFTGDMLCEEGVLLGFDHSASVSEYRDSVKKIQSFYQENGGKMILPSHHKLPVMVDIFDRYIDLCNKIIDGEIKGTYIDDGLSQGLVAKENRLQMIYNKI